VAPGTHSPVHALPTQAFWHAVVGPHSPCSLQTWTAVVEAHWVWPGWQVPPQAAPTHANSQSATSDQAPSSEHSRKRVVVAHSVEPGAHSPVHEPSTQRLGHATGSPQSASMPHSILSVGEEHSVAPGSHSPEQASPHSSAAAGRGPEFVSSSPGPPRLGTSSPSELVDDEIDPPCPSATAPDSSVVSSNGISIVAPAAALDEPNGRFLPAHPPMTRLNASANTARDTALPPRRRSRTNSIDASRSSSIVPFTKPHVLSLGDSRPETRFGECSVQAETDDGRMTAALPHLLESRGQSKLPPPLPLAGIALRDFRLESTSLLLSCAARRVTSSSRWHVLRAQHDVA
jgi:hypothetical protein